MDDLALSLDRQNAEDLSRPTELATGGRQQNQKSRQLLLPSLQRSDTNLSLASRIADHGSDDINLAAKSLEDILKEFIPDHSDMALSFGDRKSRVMFMSTWGGHLFPLGHEPNFDRVDSRRKLSRPKGHGTLVIEDVNLKCYQELRAKYPGVIDPAIFAEHTVRFGDLPVPHGNVHTINERLVTDYPGAAVNVNSSGNFMAIQMRGQDQPDELHFGWKHGFHLDIRFEATHGEAQKHILKISGGLGRHDYRTDVYERDALSYWRRISCRITCFRLEAGFCECCRIDVTRHHCR